MQFDNRCYGVPPGRRLDRQKLVNRDNIEKIFSSIDKTFFKITIIQTHDDINSLILACKYRSDEVIKFIADYNIEPNLECFQNVVEFKCFLQFKVEQANLVI